MSTKGSIHYSEGEPVQTRILTHVYHECFDEDPIQPVYIEKGGCCVVLSVAALRDLVRAVQSQVEHTTKYATETDAAIDARITAEEKKKTAYHAEWVEKGSPRPSPLAWLAHGGDKPEAERVAERVAESRKFREKCHVALAEWSKP